MGFLFFFFFWFCGSLDQWAFDLDVLWDDVGEVTIFKLAGQPYLDERRQASLCLCQTFFILTDTLHIFGPHVSC